MVGRKIECIEHDGAHQATVVYDMGFAWGAAWNLATVPANRVHAAWAAATPKDQVREVTEQ